METFYDVMRRQGITKRRHGCRSERKGWRCRRVDIAGSFAGCRPRNSSANAHPTTPQVARAVAGFS